jgi:cytochrome P460
MKRFLLLMMAIIALMLVVLSHKTSSAQDKQDKYTLKIPGGIAFSEFKGYEDWQAVGPSQTDAQNVIRLILANPVMINAYKQGVPENGKPFPEGSKIAKIEWRPKKNNQSTFFREHS